MIGGGLGIDAGLVGVINVFGAEVACLVADVVCLGAEVVWFSTGVV